jgi:hypothetical protein
MRQKGARGNFGAPNRPPWSGSRREEVEVGVEGEVGVEVGVEVEGGGGGGGEVRVVRRRESQRRGGKYVPPAMGLPSGKQMACSGQPFIPVSAWMAAR